MKKFVLSLLILFSTQIIFSQTVLDTSMNKDLEPVIIEGIRLVPDIKRLEPVQGTYIFSGKKTEVIELSKKNVAYTEKYGRQIFAKIPGVFVYDMDGTGNQVNISTRGLDPHRGWEFNIRKDGVITNTDMYGYPASHYNIPMEAVERIELVRGTGALQYGAQFGGMLNYVSKSPAADKTIAYEGINTVGSYGLVSTYNSINGTVGKVSYSTWFNKKWLNGYRDNSKSEYDAEGITLNYTPNEQFRIRLEYTHSNYIVQLAGPLTDSMFNADPQMSTRARNYYNPNIHVPSFRIDYDLNAHVKFQLTTSAVLGARNSVMFDKPANVPDTIVTTTMEYNNRQVDIDNYNSYTTELRVLYNYTIGGRTHTLTSGIQYMNNDLHRRQQGKGTTGSDYDLTLVDPAWGRDLHFKTGNVALFAENRFLITDKWSLNAGVRLESGESNLTGKITYLEDEDIPTTIEHHFPLFGVNTQYDFNPRINIYGGWSQAYRPVLLKDIVPGSVYEFTDPDLEDAFGSNLELGVRGNWRFLRWDVTGFQIQYNNRIGTIAETDTAGNLTIYKTNIGNSQSRGVELFVQGDFSFNTKANISVFTSTSYIDAKYQEATVRVGSENVSVEGNQVESVPLWISRNGFTFNYAWVSLSALFSYTAESYADALNTVEPNASGSVGIVPAYGLLDINIGMNFTSMLRIQFNINNLTDETYFTKRPQFYPGPGIWSSDGRTYSCTISIKI